MQFPGSSVAQAPQKLDAHRAQRFQAVNLVGAQMEAGADVVLTQPPLAWPKFEAWLTDIDKWVACCLITWHKLERLGRELHFGRHVGQRCAHICCGVLVA